MSDVCDFGVNIGGLVYRVRCYHDPRHGGYRGRGGYVAKLISVGVGVIMEAGGDDPSSAIRRLVADLRAGGDNPIDKKIAREIERHTTWIKGHAL